MDELLELLPVAIEPLMRPIPGACACNKPDDTVFTVLRILSKAAADIAAAEAAPTPVITFDADVAEDTVGKLGDAAVIEAVAETARDC